MAYIGVAYIGVAYIGVAYIVVAYIGVAHIGVAYIGALTVSLTRRCPCTYLFCTRCFLIGLDYKDVEDLNTDVCVDILWVGNLQGQGLDLNPDLCYQTDPP